jgi:hypothetical protein
LWIANFKEDRERGLYRFNALDRLMELPNSRQSDLAEMVMQVHRLRRALSASGNPWRELMIEFPEIKDSLLPGEEDTESRIKLVDLFRRYCAEWQLFPARPLGWELAA